MAEDTRPCPYFITVNFFSYEYDIVIFFTFIRSSIDWVISCVIHLLKQFTTNTFLTLLSSGLNCMSGQIVLTVFWILIFYTNAFRTTIRLTWLTTSCAVNTVEHELFSTFETLVLLSWLNGLYVDCLMAWIAFWEFRLLYFVGQIRSSSKVLKRRGLVDSQKCTILTSRMTVDTKKTSAIVW